MAFFDRIKEKTGDMIEVSKINSKINDEKRKIAANKAALAEYYWAKFEGGGILDSEAAALCTAIQTSNQAIQEFNQEIIKIKEQSPPTATSTTQQSSAAAPVEPAAAPQVHAVKAQTDTVLEENAPCHSCGAPLPAGKKFCSECGTPNIPPAPVVEEPAEPIKEEITSCTSCGMQLQKGKKFCPECGTPVALA